MTIVPGIICPAEFPSAPNLTAAAAAQHLDWAPVTVQSLSVVSYSLTQNASDNTALLNMSVTAELGVSGSMSDVVANASSSGRRRLLSASSSEYCESF